MAKGYIYEISKSMDSLGFMVEGDFYEVAGRIADYFRDDDRKVRSGELMDIFRKAGFETGTDTDDSEKEWPWFQFTEQARMEYFRPRYEQFRKLAEDMTLEKFSQNVYSFLDVIEDQYGDAAYWEGSYYDSLDYALRTMLPGVKYYVGNVVFAH